jgi:hypothetical protein
LCHEPGKQTHLFRRVESKRLTLHARSGPRVLRPANGQVSAAVAHVLTDRRRLQTVLDSNAPAAGYAPKCR